MSDDITKKDLSMAYRRVQVGLPISDEDAKELERRFAIRKKRGDRISLVMAMMGVALMVWFIWNTP